jgi:hypothetical protein
MESLWAKSKETNAISNGERVRSFRFKPKVSYTKEEVFHRADALRLKLEKHHPGQYSISVAVRDRHVAGWRSGKFSLTKDNDIYIYSPEEYDKEFNNVTIDLPDLVAEDMIIYVKKEKGKAK